MGLLIKRLYVLSVMILLFTPTVKTHALQCGTYLVRPLFLEKIKSVRNLVPFHRESKDLTDAEKWLIQRKITELQELTVVFNEFYSEIFENHGTEYLDDLRRTFENEDAILRRHTQLLINELKRFLNNKGNLIYRQLDILPQIKTVTGLWSIKYLDAPNSVYFNLSFFISSRLSDGTYHNGYIFSETNSEQLNSPVLVFESINKLEVDSEAESHYPGSEILIPRLANGLVFPGLPLNKDLIEFLKIHGNTKGRIQVAPNYHYKKRNNILGSIISYFQTQDRLPIFTSRWSPSRQTYFEIQNLDGSVNNDLFNLSNYFEHSGHLMIPTLPVVWDKKSQRIFPKSEDQLRQGLVAVEADTADFTVTPTPYEFLVAFSELIQPKGLAPNR